MQNCNSVAEAMCKLYTVKCALSKDPLKRSTIRAPLLKKDAGAIVQLIRRAIVLNGRSVASQIRAFTGHTLSSRSSTDVISH